jgi:DNA-binding GntR family transcriptional regulator
MPVPVQRDAIDRHLLRDNAYTSLRDAIVDGTLAPGEDLHDVELCAWLGLSRTPVRDALARLEDEGLVVIAPQRYTRVTPLRAADAHDAFPLLAAIHALATELGVPALARIGHERLRTANDAYTMALATGDAGGAYAADERFHALFVEAAHNSDIERALERMAPRLRRFERLRSGPAAGRREIAQHEAIIARAAAGDAPRTASAVRENWLTLGALIERSLARMETTGAGGD